METVCVQLAPSDLDSAVHYWYRLKGNILPHRLCDGALGMKEWPTSGYQLGDTCMTCREVYLTDVGYGNRVLRFSEAPSSWEENDNGRVVPCSTIVIRSCVTTNPKCQGRGNGMPRASLAKFIQFCEAPTQKKEGVVGGRGFNYYGPLIARMQRTHWATGLIDTFRTELPSFLEDQNTATKRENLRLVGEAYIEYWLDRATAYFPVGQYEVNLAGLAMRIGPAVGMLNRDGDREFLRLWCKQGSPSFLARQIIGCLMDEVKEDSSWHSGVLDIQGKNVPLPVQISGNFRGELEDQATMYLDYLRQPN